ncbi:hypothetical protein [Natronoflexus pectinivorans]|uniref:Uncharacterized protein n=1 Tax=Natronoflexus pectinivorans TaxID=682526 RepID=A0A4R2GK07_9BACT|nr:hypothetical protein [Natronoflexus pectinivorans]TCO07750.1 hypothetical protein EV194_107134 [Natronoflexus pectinivorans]
MRAFVIIALFLCVLFPSCNNQDGKYVEVFLIPDGLDSINKTSVKLRIVNNTSEDVYILGMNPFIDMRFISDKNFDISKDVWDDFYFSLTVPKPPDSIAFSQQEQNYRDFLSCAQMAEIGRVKSVDLSGDSSEFVKDFMNVIGVKYELAILVKSNAFYEREFTFNIRPDSLKAIKLSYDYSCFFNEIDEYFLYESKHGSYYINNKPLKEVCGYSLFQGSFEAELRF